MHPFQRTAAIFDIDDSLLDGNCGTVFTWFLLQQSEMRADIRAKIPRAVYDFLRKKLSESDMVALAARSHAGIRADRLRDLARACFLKHIEKRVTAGGLRMVRKHLLAGHFVLIASGSPQYIVDELGRFLHAHEAVGTRAMVKDGVFTDEILPPVAFREGKRERVREVAEAYGLDLGKSYLYSDSAADTPLFERVGHAVVVNPKSTFRADAERRGWDVVEWEGRWGGGELEDQRFPEEEWGSWES